MCNKEPNTSLKMKSEEIDVFKKPKPPTKKRTYSNTLADCVKIFCGVCDQIINLSGLRKHLNIHKIGQGNYVKLYGNAKTQIIKMMYHQCGICRQDVVLDYDALSKHLKTVHKVKGRGISEYSNQHLKMRLSKSIKADTANSATTTTLSRATTKPEVCVDASTIPAFSPSPRVAPVPTCNHCSRLFRSNMQLKMHMRREHADNK